MNSKFENTKKIKVTDGYFQVAKSIHPKNGESVAISAIPTKQKDINGRMVPAADYEGKSTHFFSFNQASILASKLRTAAMKTELDRSYRHEIRTGAIDNIKKISLSDIQFNKTIKVDFENGNKVTLYFNVDTANIAADLINHRMYELNIEQNESEDDSEINIQDEIIRLEKKLVKSDRVTSLVALRAHIRVKMCNEHLTQIDALKEVEAEIC